MFRDDNKKQSLSLFLPSDDTPTTFKCDSAANTPNSSIIAGDASESEECSPMDDAFVDISIEKPSKNAPKRRGRKRNASVEEVDLTFSDPALSSPTKSRRKIVDELKDAIIEAEIDLCNLGTPEPEEISTPVSQNRRGRPSKAKPKAAKKPKKVSYKKALAVTNAIIPELDKSPILASGSQVSVSSSASSIPEIQTSNLTATRSYDDFAIDLTGEVSLKSYHNTAPLFQKSTEARATRSSTKVQTQTQKKRSICSQEMDIDIDAVTLHIKVNGKMEKFQHNPDHRFFGILKAISERHNVQVSNVLLFNEKDKRIQPDETPNDIGHKISSIYSEF